MTQRVDEEIQAQAEDANRDSVDFEDATAIELDRERRELFERLVSAASHWDGARLLYLSYLTQIPTRWVNDFADKVYLSLEAAVHAEYLRDRAEECRIRHSRAARSLVEEGFPVGEWITLGDGETVVYIQPAKRRMNSEYTEPCVLFEEITENSEPLDGEEF